MGNVLNVSGAGNKLAADNDDEFTCIAQGNTFDYVSNFKDDVFRNIKFIREIPDDALIYSITENTFDNIPYAPNICINGYFTQEEYYDNKLCKELFGCPDNIRVKLYERFPILGTHTVCTISVRRGDYFKYLYKHNICTMQFYRDAMKHMPDDCVYIVCSDDLEWCHKNFKGDKFFFADGLGPAEQLYIQSLAHHNIISNSSFSQWGAFLNEHDDKIIVAPRRWFGYKATRPSSNIYRKDWTIVDNKIPLTQQIRARLVYFDRKYWSRIKRLPGKPKRMLEKRRKRLYLRNNR